MALPQFDSWGWNKDRWWQWRVLVYKAGQGITMDLWTLRLGPLSIYWWRDVPSQEPSK